MELKNLKKQINYSWKIQTKPTSEKKWACVAYIDSRDAQSLLDEVCGQEWWQSLFYEVKWKVFCKVWIKVWDEWIWKSDSWALDDNENVESETTSKWETSDAFKRACVQWGIWRFLYDLEIKWITLEEYNANKYKLSEFCNWNWTPPKTDTSKTEKKWLNYDIAKEYIDAGNTTPEQFKKTILEDWYTISQAGAEAMKHYFETWELVKNMFFKK